MRGGCISPPPPEERRPRIAHKQVLAANSAALKLQNVNYHARNYWYLDYGCPQPIWDMFRCTAYNGYTLVFVYIVATSISHKVPTGKHIRFMNAAGIVMYSISELLLLADITSFYDMLGLCITILLILLMLLDVYDQY